MEPVAGEASLSWANKLASAMEIRSPLKKPPELSESLAEHSELLEAVRQWNMHMSISPDPMNNSWYRADCQKRQEITEYLDVRHLPCHLNPHVQPERMLELIGPRWLSLS